MKVHPKDCQNCKACANVIMPRMVSAYYNAPKDHEDDSKLTFKSLVKETFHNRGYMLMWMCIAIVGGLILGSVIPL